MYCDNNINVLFCEHFQYNMSQFRHNFNGGFLQYIVSRFKQSVCERDQKVNNFSKHAEVYHTCHAVFNLMENCPLKSPFSALSSFSGVSLGVSLFPHEHVKNFVPCFSYLKRLQRLGKVSVCPPKAPVLTLFYCC